MNSEGITFGVQQANTALKKLVGVSKQSDKSLSSLAFLKKLEVGFRVLTSTIGKVTNAVRSFFQVLKNPVANMPLFGSSISSFFGFVDEITQSTLKMYNLGRAIGATINEMQALRLVANDVGLEMSQLYEPIAKLPRKIQFAVQGIGDSRAIFDQLPGIDLNALRDLGSPLKQLKTVSDSLNKIGDKNTQLALINLLFEESGAKFIRLFELGADGIDGVMKKVKELGLELSGLDVEKFLRLNNLTKEISLAWEGLQRELVLNISPNLIQFLEVVRELITSDKFRTQLVDTLTDLFMTVGSIFLNFTNGFLLFAAKVDILISTLSTKITDWAPNAKTGISDAWATNELNAVKLLKWLNSAGGTFGTGRGFVGFGFGEYLDNMEKTYEDQLGRPLSSQESSLIKQFADILNVNMKSLEALEAELKWAAFWRREKANKPDFDQDKFIEKITYSAASNAASATPGKLTGGLDAREGGGIEMMFKYLEPGYGEDKEITLLKKIEKVLKRIEGQGKAGNAGIEGAM
jgi:hypothetical protein